VNLFILLVYGLVCIFTFRKIDFKVQKPTNYYLVLFAVCFSERAIDATVDMVSDIANGFNKT
jgi:hypothetical protein